MNQLTPSHTTNKEQHFELPVVAIVGRQNVGKSTLFNRLANRRIAIVEDLPGTTRDRIMTEVSLPGGGFMLMDTGGLEIRTGSSLSQQVNRQVGLAIEKADVILFLVDAQDGLIPGDQDIAQLLRPVQKPVILVANKADNNKLEMGAPEFSKMGLGEALAISAYHGRGINDLLDVLTACLPDSIPLNVPPEMLKTAIVGRPNVGKSMLLNALLGEERVIVSEIPGTTRDAVDTLLDFEGRNVLLIDTAGIKRRGRQGQGVDKYSVERSLKAIERADIALLVLDAGELITEQDLHIAGYIQQAYKGIVVIVNKWDLAIDLDKNEIKSIIHHKLKFMTYAPVIFTSARTGEGVKQIMLGVFAVYQERMKRISTAELNSAMQRVIGEHTPPHKGERALKFLYSTQAEVNPPTFVFFVNDASLMHFSYQRYIENRLRRAFGFEGTPLRLIFKTRGEE
jgi:GTP-binding protein